MVISLESKVWVLSSASLMLAVKRNLPAWEMVKSRSMVTVCEGASSLTVVMRVAP